MSKVVGVLMATMLLLGLVEERLGGYFSPGSSADWPASISRLDTVRRCAKLFGSVSIPQNPRRPNTLQLRSIPTLLSEGCWADGVQGLGPGLRFIPEDFVAQPTESWRISWKRTQTIIVPLKYIEYGFGYIIVRPPHILSI